MGAVNMDLIAGLPADTPAGFRRTVEEVLAMAPENITVHTLALKKGARLRQEETPLPSGTDVAAMLDFAWRPCARPVICPTTCTGRNSCRGPLKTWAGANLASSMSITSV